MFGSDKRTQPGFQHFLGLPIAYEVSVGAVVFRRGAQGVEYLLLRYPHGHWDYVKGHIEAGESQEDTLRREAREEAGIELSTIVSGFRKSTRYFYTAKGTELEKRKRQGRGIWIFKTVHFYLAEVASDAQITISDEHIGFAWLPLEEAVGKLTFLAARDILESADTFLKKAK